MQIYKNLLSLNQQTKMCSLLIIIGTMKKYRALRNSHQKSYNVVEVEWRISPLLIRHIPLISFIFQTKVFLFILVLWRLQTRSYEGNKLEDCKQNSIQQSLTKQVTRYSSFSGRKCFLFMVQTTHKKGQEIKSINFNITGKCRGLFTIIT